jgi:hypothetical protein
VAKQKKYRSFPETREWTQGLGLEGKAHWYRYWECNKIPPDIPKDPAQYYKKTREWTGWGDFLGTGNIRRGDMKHVPWVEAREFARRLGLKTQADWASYCKSDKKRRDIPLNPDRYYKKTREWTDWNDFLDTGYIHPRNMKFAPWPEARRFAQGLGIKSGADWKRYWECNEKPPDIPKNPAHYL